MFHNQELPSRTSSRLLVVLTDNFMSFGTLRLLWAQARGFKTMTLQNTRKTKYARLVQRLYRPLRHKNKALYYQAVACSFHKSVADNQSHLTKYNTFY
jgi:hypothetical protein